MPDSQRYATLLVVSAAVWVAGLGTTAMAQVDDAETSTEAPAAGTSAEEERDQNGTGERSARRSLPRLGELSLPTAEELLHGTKLDWVVLDNKDEHVLITAPVLPRPDTLEKMQIALDQKLKERKNLTGEALEQYRRELEELAHIELDLPDQVDETIYEIHMDKVARVIHHEDLMLRRIDELVRQENFELAYELLNVLRRNTPDWPGAAERHAQFLLAEAERRERRGELEPALATIEEAHDRNASFRGVSEAAGGVVDQLVEQSVQAGDWRRARHFINRLQDMYASHPVAERWVDELSARALELLAQAEQSRATGDHGLAASQADSAARVWPNARNLRTRHRIFTERYQRLHVGVLDLPTSGFGDPVLASAADQRADLLQGMKFFHVDNADDGSAHYASRFSDRWEPLNLGREAVFELRSSRQPWEMQPILKAPEIASFLARRLDPRDELYDERLAGYTNSIHVRSPFSFTVHFDRVPVRTEALLTIPVEPAGAAAGLEEVDGLSSVSTSADSERGGFLLEERTAEMARYVRSIDEPAGQRLYHLAEVRERRYGSYAEAFQALLRGDVSMVPSLPPRFIERLRNDEALMKQLFVQKMALPQTHVIQLNPRSVPLKNRELRRALMYAVDRRAILSSAILDGAPRDLARLVTGPFPSESYANSALAVRREHDKVSAISLALAARKQLGGTLPPLKMVVVEEPLVQAAAREIVDGWKLFGIEVEMIPPPPRLVDPAAEAAEWDLLYRTVQMVEPVVELWPFLTLTGRAQVSDLDPFPDWLRQEIIGLDLIGDWSDAVHETTQIHLHLWSEVMFIPLWEVDQYLVYRKNIRGLPVNPVSIYDEVDHWVVEAWYPSDEP